MSSWIKKERKRKKALNQHSIAEHIETRRSKKHVVRNIDTFTESRDLTDQCRASFSVTTHISGKRFTAILRFIASGIGGAHSKTMKPRRFMNSFQFLISGSRPETFGRENDQMDGWKYVSIMGDDNKFRARMEGEYWTRCSGISIIFVQE